MIVDLVDTTAGAVDAEITRQRRQAGGTSGMVLTLVVAVDEGGHHDALRAAAHVATEHPCRIVAVVPRGGRVAPRLDAEVRVGGDAGPGETAVLRLYGSLARHPGSVVLPLLLPDAPVVVWWPGAAPDVPAEDPLGGLARRRVTDAAGERRPLAALERRAAGYRPGDTDFAWTRLTGWRTLLASALDTPTPRIRSAEVAAERGNPSAALLAGWLRARLGVEATVRASRGPGITAVRLRTGEGDVAVTRPDGRRAVLSRPGEPDRGVALARRPVTELLAEELRRLDADEPYAEALAAVTAAPPPARGRR